MTRIIAGSAGGRRIRTPPGDGTRPTTDRVREALFSAVESAIGTVVGIRFLDLYAGSGAVGLEARSRGAAEVVLVERDRRTAQLIRDNAAALGLSHVEAVGSAVAGLLRQTPRAPYDVVFSDPPYALDGDVVEADLAALVARRWVSPGGLVVLERSARAPGVRWPPGLEAGRTRRYGETALWYGHAASTPPPEEP